MGRKKSSEKALNSGSILDPKKNEPSLLQLDQITGGIVNKVPLLYSKKHNCIFNAVGNKVHMYLFESGEYLQSFPSKLGEGHSDDIISMFFVDSNHSKFCTVSSEGSICVWDLVNDGSLLQKFNLEYSLYYAKRHPIKESLIYFIGSASNNNERSHNYFSFGVFDLEKKEEIGPSQALHLSVLGFDVFHDGSLAVAISQYFMVIISIDLQRPHFHIHRIKLPETPTCVNFHPTAIIPTVFVGDLIGKIHVWEGVGKNYHTPKQWNFHWHSGPVLSMAFTESGQQLTTGGTENVLVFWQMDNYVQQFINTKKGYMYNITHFEDDIAFGVSFSDNSFIVYSSSNNEPLFSVVGVGFDTTKAAKVHPPVICLDQVNNNVIIGGYEAKAQIFNPVTNSNINMFETVPRVNERTLETLKSRISHICLSKDSTWLTTVDQRAKHNYFSSETALKFWKKSPNGLSNYELVTRIESPHGSYSLKSIALCNTQKLNSTLAATCGDDKIFRIWKLHTFPEGEQWILHAERQYKSLQPTTVDFSNDGSLLAVAFDKVITLWDTTRFQIQHTLYCPIPLCVTQVYFIKDMPLLLSVTAQQLIIWNLITCEVSWCLSIQAEEVIVAPNSTFFAVRTVGDTPKILVFDAVQAELLYKFDINFKNYKRMLFFHTQRNVHSPCIEILGLTEKNEFHILRSETLKAQSPTWYHPDSMEIEEKVTPIFGRQLVRTANEVNHLHKQSSVFNGPSHILPSVDSLFEEFMSGFLNLNV